MQENGNNVPNQSEVARLISQIDAECEAARLAMNGFAGVAKHEAITARMERMGALHDELRAVVGEREATEALVRAMDGSREARALQPEPDS